MNNLIKHLVYGVVAAAWTIAAVVVTASIGGQTAQAQETASAVGPLMKLLESGRLPPERVGTVLEMVCTRGNGHDLAVVFQQLTADGGYQGDLRNKALAGLIAAFETRKVKPAGDLSSLKKLLADEDPKTKAAALKLAAFWKAQALVPELQKLAEQPGDDRKTFALAVDALTQIGGDEARKTLEKLTDKASPQWKRYQAVGALVRFDSNTAAQRAAEVLADGTAQDDPSALLEPFFQRKGAADQLAAAVASKDLPQDVLKMALRYMYATGRSDPALSAALSKVPDPPPPTPEELKQLALDTSAMGDTTRGEAIFRRADLSCFRCHAVHKAGGEVGPDLSAVGSNSPVDYIVTSILLPSQAIKEQYLTAIVATADGNIFHGVVVERNSDQLILRDANGKLIKIPVDDIDDEAEGKSLMPNGLTKFLTKQELLDLSKFVSELGKPGPFAIPSVERMQRWRLLQEPSADLLRETPNVEILREHLLDLPADAWAPYYSRANGALPLDELAEKLAAKQGGKIVFLQGEIEVTEAGEAQIVVSPSAGVDLWLNAEPFDLKQPVKASLDVGRHRITLRVDLSVASKELTLTLPRLDDSTVQLTVVGGL